MSFFKPKLLPLCASFVATYTFSAIYASMHSDANTGTYQAFRNSALGCLYYSFDSFIKQRGSFFNNAFCFAYQTSGLLAFCAWHETGSKIAFLWGAMTLVHQARWAYNSSVMQSIFTFEGGETQPHPPAGNPPPYYQQQQPTVHIIDATVPSAPPAANYGMATNPGEQITYPDTRATATGNYDLFTRNNSDSIGRW